MTKTCDTCKKWTQSDYKVPKTGRTKKAPVVIKGGFCSCDKFMNGYYLPAMKFKDDCITFAIDIQTKSLYYTGAKFGCIHHEGKDNEQPSMDRPTKKLK